MDRNKNQLGLFNPNESYANKKIVIVGAGGVGSTTAYYISQMGCNNISVIDYDEVEIHNTASQYYKQSDIGRLKVEALAENIEMFNGVHINPINSKYESSLIEDADIVICAVDDMLVRKQVVEDCYELDVDHIVEARMSGEDFMLFSFNPLIDKDRWLGYWYPPEEALPEICTMKSISYNTGMIGSMISKLIRDYMNGIPTPFIIRVDGIYGVIGEY